jgi:hypothetical protein
MIPETIACVVGNHVEHRTVDYTETTQHNPVGRFGGMRTVRKVPILFAGEKIIWRIDGVPIVVKEVA